MKTIIIAITLIIFLNQLCFAQHIVIPSKDNSLAIIVGNSNYKGIANLNNIPVNDAMLMEQKLTECGFTTVSLINRSRKDILSVLKSIRDDEQKWETILFYYSGHGIMIDGDYCLIPTEADITTSPLESEEYIEINAIFRAMHSQSSVVNITIIDACRSYNIGGGSTKINAKEYNLNSHVMFYATQEYENIDLNLNRRYSQFTGELANYIASDDEIKVIGQKLTSAFIDKDVKAVPVISGSLSNNIEFYFRNSKGVITAQSGYKDLLNYQEHIKEDKKMNNLISGRFTDSRDSKIYKWVRYGSQIWMTDNLDFTEKLEHVKKVDRWSSFDKNREAYTYYEDGLISGLGCLYTWAAAKKACPLGWHLPTNKEWEQLVDFMKLNGYSNSRSVIDEKIARSMASNNGWREVPIFWKWDPIEKSLGYKSEQNNRSKFNGKPAGVIYAGKYQDQGEVAVWWSSSPKNYSYVWAFGLSFMLDRVVDYKYADQKSGLSVRCVKDKP